MKHEFKEIVDRRLSHITWTEAQSREVLRLISEEERPVKKMRLGVVVVVAVLCLSLATALAAGLVFNPRVEAVRLAEQALEAKYGVTSEMLTHFSRSVETVDGGYKAVYTGAGALEGVLGAYTVEVKDGAAEATWSHDGADTSGGLDALAWGSEQLAEMLRLHKENRNGILFKESYIIGSVINIQKKCMLAKAILQKGFHIISSVQQSGPRQTIIARFIFRNFAIGLQGRSPFRLYINCTGRERRFCGFLRGFLSWFFCWRHSGSNRRLCACVVARHLTATQQQRQA